MFVPLQSALQKTGKKNSLDILQKCEVPYVTMAYFLSSPYAVSVYFSTYSLNPQA